MNAKKPNKVLLQRYSIRLVFYPKEKIKYYFLGVTFPFIDSTYTVSGTLV